MPTDADWREWDRRRVWHAFTQMQGYEPLLIERASGCTLYDIDGNAYLDGVSSLWCNVHGHGHPRLNAAITDQLTRVAHVTSLGMGNPPAAELAARLVERAPAGLEHVFFSGDGACAVEAALKMAFQYWRQVNPAMPRKTRFVAFEDAYHGDTLGSASVGGVERFHAMFRPLLFETHRLPPPDRYRPPTGIEAADVGRDALDRLDALLAEQADGIAGVIIEPLVQCAAGILVHPDGFLRGVRERTRRHGVLMIADEVAVGMGRAGTLFACEREGVTPDLLCLGKGLTGGYLPMSATMATGPIWDAFLGAYSESKTFYHGHTFAGNPLAAAAALASLDIFDGDRVLESLPQKVERLARGLEPLADLPIVGDVRQCGMIAGIELVRDKARREPFPWEMRVGGMACDRALRAGVWLRPLGNVIVLMPPLAIRDSELDRILDVLRQAIIDVGGELAHPRSESR
ncbi:MAG: adenosylmethionine--8-amino-7-oxononanoate transaminase [Planctomycetes bacterium]|nr:adenosylmethionine--8-amino-7-oxononanoate transaminase [Planctomycetota bacterium]